MAKVKLETEIDLYYIKFGDKNLSGIAKRIDDILCDAFKDISLNRQNPDNQWVDIEETIEAYLCEIQDLVGLIK